MKKIIISLFYLLMTFVLFGQSPIVDICVAPLHFGSDTFEVKFKPTQNLTGGALSNFQFSVYWEYNAVNDSIFIIPNTSNWGVNYDRDISFLGPFNPYGQRNPMTIYETDDGTPRPLGYQLEWCFFSSNAYNDTDFVAGNFYSILQFKIINMPRIAPGNNLYITRSIDYCDPEFYNIQIYPLYFQYTGTAIGPDVTNGICPTCSNPILLPIELISFTAKWNNADQSQVLVQWTTASEINNEYFLVEHSADAINWSVVGKVDGSGNSNTVKYYNNIDFNPYSRYTYYRLKQVDYDGKYTYSEIVALQKSINTFGKDININIYPNPSYDIVNVRFSDAIDGKIYLSIYDFAGKLIYSEDFFANENKYVKTLNTSNFPVGIYTIKIRNDSFERIQKLIKN